MKKKQAKPIGVSNSYMSNLFIGNRDFIWFLFAFYGAYAFSFIAYFDINSTLGFTKDLTQ